MPESLLSAQYEADEGSPENARGTTSPVKESWQGQGEWVRVHGVCSFWGPQPSRVAQAGPNAELAGDASGQLTRAICRAAAVEVGKLAESPSESPGPTPAELLLVPARGRGWGTRGIPAALLHKPSLGACRRHCADVSGQPVAELWESLALSLLGLCWVEQPRGSFGEGSGPPASRAFGRGGGFGGRQPVPSPHRTRGR